MKNFILIGIILITKAAQAVSPLPEIKAVYSKHSDETEKLYRALHQNPELSGKEFKTAKLMADELKKMGLQVTEKIGGTGLVGILKNGNGPTIWLRADMDGLPIQEETKKSYASRVPGVMHACGHDTHMASLVGYAKTLKQLKDKWSGTLVFIVQPAEETGHGAEAMINDGLYKKFPKPDYVLGLHVSGLYDSGKITYTEGYALAAVDAIDIEVKGYGGHGAAPEKAIDPVVLASKIILNTQTLVSRNIDTREAVVLTYGSIHGGTKHNIIPDSVHIQGTLRTYSPEVRKKMKAGIKRMTEALAKAEGAKKPSVTFSQSLPPTFNHIELTKRLRPLFEKVAGKANVVPAKGIMGAEDFAHYSQNRKYPTSYFFIGGAPKNKKNFGLNHNSKFAPEYKKVLSTGVQVMSLAVMDLAPKKK